MPLDKSQNDSAQAPVKMFACYCSAQDEGFGDPPDCWSCGKSMRQWGIRVGRAATSLNAIAADKRTANGGYDG